MEWPHTKKKQFEMLGLTAPRGILLHGPPGCAKVSALNDVLCLLACVPYTSNRFTPIFNAFLYPWFHRQLSPGQQLGQLESHFSPYHQQTSMPHLMLVKLRLLSDVHSLWLVPLVHVFSFSMKLIPSLHHRLPMNLEWNEATMQKV